EVNEEEVANDVRIIFVSADLSKAITTSVLWLIERDIDIKCIRIRTQKDGSKLYFDIQNVIPLPEATDYQVKLSEKAREQRQTRREGSRELSKFDVKVNGRAEFRLNKRQTMDFVISECLKTGIDPKDLMRVTGEKKWIWVDKICYTKQEFESEITRSAKKY